MAAYLHYYFYNYEGKDDYDVSDFDQQKKKVILAEQLAAFQKNKQQLTKNAELADMGDVLNFLTGEDGDQKRKQVLDQTAGTGADQNIDFILWDNLTIGQIGGKNGLKYIGDKAEEIAAHIQEFQKKLEDFCQEAYVTFMKGNTWESYKKTVIQQYQISKGIVGDKANGVVDKNLAKSIIADFLKHDGLITLSDISGNPMETALAKLVALAQALPEYDITGKEKYSTSRNSKMQSVNDIAQCLKVLAGKVSGLWSNVKGTGAELAIATAEEELIKMLGDKLQDIEKDFSGGTSYVSGKSWLQVINQLDDSQLKELTDNTNKALEQKHVAKGDVSIKLTKNGVAIQYGISVKNYKATDVNAKHINLDISNGNDFISLYRDSFPGDSDLLFLYHVAGAHPGITPGTRQSGIIYPTTKDLEAKWDSLKQQVVYSNFLTFLTGLPHENVIYMIVNKQLYDIEDVVKSAVNNPDILMGSMNTPKRATLMDYNKWEKDKPNTDEEPESRSSLAMKKMHNSLSQAKMNIHLNLLLQLAK